MFEHNRKFQNVKRPNLGNMQKDISCHAVNVIYYFKGKMRMEKKTYIRKTISGNIKGFYIAIYQHISDCKMGKSTSKFP